jgi:hypothetical protein
LDTFVQLISIRFTLRPLQVKGLNMRAILLLTAAFGLSGCIAKTAVDLVTLPVRAATTVVSHGVDAVTTSRSERDRAAGRRLREEDQRRGREAREAERREQRERAGQHDAGGSSGSQESQPQR